MIAAGGCVALNAGFEESDGSTEGAASSDTGRQTTSDGDSNPSAGGSAVTTVTAGESNGSDTSDPTDSGVTTMADTGGPPPVSSTGESSGGVGTSGGETGGVPCIPLSADVSDDAFLVECFGECAARNYGQTPAGPLASGDDESSVLLLRVPVPASDNWAYQIAVTVEIVAENDVVDSDVSLAAYAISPPCDWDEGQRDDEFLEPGEAGVTFRDCDGDPDTDAPWTDGGSVWGHEDTEWESGEITLKAGDYLLNTPLSVTIILDRAEAGPTPGALLIALNAPFFGDLVVTAAEGEGVAPQVDVYAECFRP